MEFNDTLTVPFLSLRYTDLVALHDPSAVDVTKNISYQGVFFLAFVSIQAYEHDAAAYE